MKNVLRASILGVVILGVLAKANAESALEKNKRLVREFYDLAFNQHRPIDAANKYLVPNYKQHNPNVADGREGFIAAFGGQPKNDQSKSEFKRFIAENDLVVVHSFVRRNANDRGVAVVDIFRITGDKITEHWDVIQAVPEKAANTNTMF